MKLPLAFASLAALACAAPRPPAPRTHEGTVLAIYAKMTPPIGFGSRPIETVYFARLEEGDLGTEVVPSNYAVNGYVYLLDAPPGRYAPVAFGFSTQTQASSGGPVGGGVSVTTSVSITNQTIVYLTEILIQKLSADLESGSAVLLGRVHVGTDASFDGADPAQHHYHQLIGGGQETGFFSVLGGGGVFLLAEQDYDFDAGSESLARSRSHAQEHLAGTIWEPSLSSVAARPEAD